MMVDCASVPDTTMARQQLKLMAIFTEDRSRPFFP